MIESIIGWFAPFISTTWLFGSLSVAGLGAIAWFSPSFKVKAVALALIAVIGSNLYTFNKAHRLGEAHTQSKWDAAEAAAKKLGKDVRDRAVADDISGVRDPNDCHYQGNSC